MSEPRRFVVLSHHLPVGGERGDHWDLMFEFDGALRAWALDCLPQTGRSGDALLLPDHRLAYLDYEGPVSGDRGSVRRWDAGRYELLAQSADFWQARLAGERLRGLARLERRDAQRWSVSFGESSGAAAGSSGAGEHG